jgi:ADP-ribose pyrophosphatase YjhB (NUDIX family)
MGILDGWRFCPRCGAETDRHAESARCARCGFVVWANSAPAVQGLVERDGRILLGRRGIEPGYGKWDLPGGFLHEGEHPLDGLRREVCEETGLEIEPGPFVGFWLEPYDGRVVLSITYEATTAGGDAQPADDLIELRWFAPGEVPGAAELAFPSYVEILGLWRQQHA